jgi:hypothetical protein
MLTGSQNDSKIPTKKEKKFRKTFEKMEGFNFVTPITGLNGSNSGKEDDVYHSRRNVWSETFQKIVLC